MSTILIVANQTLPSEALATEVSEPDRVRRPGLPHHRSGDAAAGAVASPGTRTRPGPLRKSASRPSESDWRPGVTADGEIGDRDPVAAVQDADRGREVSEVILSTLPSGASRWLRQDVPSRMRGAIEVPITVVQEQPAAAGR